LSRRASIGLKALQHQGFPDFDIGEKRSGR
jgi:hypothetical protein